jgi:hypothetical protein
MLCLLYMCACIVLILSGVLDSFVCFCSFVFRMHAIATMARAHAAEAGASCASSLTITLVHGVLSRVMQLAYVAALLWLL